MSFTSLSDLVHGKRLPVARIDNTDVQLLHPLEAGFQRLGVINKRGNRWAGPVFEEVPTEERSVICPHGDGPSGVPRDVQDRDIKPVFRKAIAVFKIEVRGESNGEKGTYLISGVGVEALALV